MKEWDAYYGKTNLGWALAENLDEVKSKFFEKFPEHREKKVEFIPVDPNPRYASAVNRLTAINNQIHNGNLTQKRLVLRNTLEQIMQYYDDRGYRLHMESC